MILCICNNVSERAWRATLAAHGHDLQAAAMACGAGQCCGSCQEELEAHAQARPVWGVPLVAVAS